MGRKSIALTETDINAVISRVTSAKQAATLLGVTYTSFLRYAKKFELLDSLKNQGRKGHPSLKKGRHLYTIEQLLIYDSPIASNRLKLRLFEAGLKSNECEKCGLGPTWNGTKLTLQLDHKDGDSKNNRLENLQILCPNCHTQTATFCRGQGKSKLKTLEHNLGP